MCKQELFEVNLMDPNDIEQTIDVLQAKMLFEMSKVIDRCPLPCYSYSLETEDSFSIEILSALVNS
jgi:hypothetical protein